MLLFRFAPAHYYRLRNVCLLSGALGLLVFALFPVAPPRLAPSGLQDTITDYATTYRRLLSPSIVNEYAAMPSFHAGWSLMLGIELFRASRRVLVRAMAVALPCAMAFAVVATANHYVLDVLAGALAVGLALLVVTLREHRNAPARLARPARRSTPHVAVIPRCSGVEQPQVERVAHELRARGAANLLLDVGAVGLDRARGQEELAGDLGVGVAEGDQPQHLELALGQVVGRPAGLGGRGGQLARRAAG